MAATKLKEHISMAAIDRAKAILEASELGEELVAIARLFERIDALEERLDHAKAALRFIARTCVEDPDSAQFASRASYDVPSAFAPKEDYERKA